MLEACVMHLYTHGSYLGIYFMIIRAVVFGHKMRN